MAQYQIVNNPLFSLNYQYPKATSAVKEFVATYLITFESKLTDEINLFKTD